VSRIVLMRALARQRSMHSTCASSVPCTPPEKAGRRHTFASQLGRRQRGQSLVEMAIACIVLVPLAAGVMLLGQYIHIKHQAQQAARAAAWEATAYPDEATQQRLPDKAALAGTLRARYFGLSEDAVRSNAQAPQALADPMLRTFAGTMLLKPSDIQLAVYQQDVGPDVFDKGLSMVGKVAKSLGKLPPNPKGLVTAEVRVRPQLLADANGKPLAFLAPLDTEQLEFSAKTVLLADAWNAAGGGENRDGTAVNGASNRTVRNVVRPLVPTDWAGNSVMNGINDVMHMLGDVPLLDDVLTAGWKNIAFGKVAPDAVPADKLVKYADQH